VWGIGEDQHLVAAFYRNTAIHILVDRAIAETALLAAAENAVTSTHGTVLPVAVRDEALRLRELLKFEFLFSARAQFEKDLADEVRLIGPVEDTSKSADAAVVRGLLESADLLLAHLVLRPFLDAYHIVADRLAAYEDESFDEDAFLSECLEVGKQWELQHRIASAESRSLELFKTALRLARHRERSTGSSSGMSPNGDASSPTRSRPPSDGSTRSGSWAGGDPPKVVGMPLTGEYAPSPWDWSREQADKYAESGGSEAADMKGKPIILLTTVGAKTSKLRKTPLMRVEHNGEYAVVASLGGAPKNPVWYYNIAKNPRVELQDGGVTGDYDAHEVFGDEKATWWERAVEAWPDYADYQKKTDRQIPVFVLTPVS